MKKLLFLVLIAAVSFSFMPNGKDRGLLVVTVLDETGNIQEGAEVTIFEKEEDHSQLQNGNGPVKTNENGKAKFKGLKLIEYYVYVEKGGKNNMFGPEKTAKLEPNKYNKVNIIIE